jgi:predicted MFS family arabinose efflux permease
MLTDRLAAPTALRRSGDLPEVVLGCLLFVAGSAIFYMMPAYLTYVGGRLALDPAALGTLAAVESLAIGLASLSGPAWVGRIDRRLLLILGIVASVVGNLATVEVSGFRAVLACRFAVGLLGEGVLYTVSFAILGGVRNVDRAFAMALTAAVVFGAATTAGATFLNGAIPPLGLLAPLVMIALAVAPFLLRPAAKATAPSPAETPTRAGWGAGLAVLALVAQAIWFGAPGAFWSFAEQVAIDKGVAADTAELGLSLGELASLIGSLFAAWAAGRWGRRGPIVAASAGMCLAAVAYQLSDGVAPLTGCLSVFYIFWNYGTVYQIGLAAELDRGGRVAVMIPAAQVFGLSVGPFCAGRMMLRLGDGAVTIATCAFAGLALLLYVACFARRRRADAAQPSAA